jgi:sec-independent protein translocase protein TatC
MKEKNNDSKNLNSSKTNKENNNLTENSFLDGIINNNNFDQIIDFLKTVKGPLKRVFACFFIFLILGFFFSINIVGVIQNLLPTSILLVSSTPIDAFISVFSLIIIFAVVFTFPFAIFEIIRFVSPALYERERKVLYRLIPISLILFVVGAIFGIFVMSFFGLVFFADFASSFGINNFWNFSGVISSLIFIAVGFGIAFQLPIVTIFLVKFNIVSLEILKKLRPFLIIFLLIISALLTPPDIISQLAMAIPLYFLFEVTLLYLKVFNK